MARVSTAPLRPGAADELTSHYCTRARALYEACNGFHGSLLLLNHDKSIARSVTLWARTTDMDAAVNHPEYADVMKGIARHFTDVPDTEMWQLGGAFLMERDLPKLAEAEKLEAE